MKYLVCFSLMMSIATLPGCGEKADDSSSETETSGTASTTDDDGTTTTTTTATEPTTGGDTGDATGTTSSSTTAPIDEDCAFLVGKMFVSKKQWPCGPPRDPEMPGPLCPDRVSFEADTFDYLSGDFGVSGTYTCEGGVIAGSTGDESYSGTVDAAAGQLIWEDTEFEVE